MGLSHVLNEGLSRIIRASGGGASNDGALCARVKAVEKSAVAALFPKAYSGAFAILVQKDHTFALKCDAERHEVGAHWLCASCFETGDRALADTAQLGEPSLRNVQQAACGPALRWIDSHAVILACARIQRNSA